MTFIAWVLVFFAAGGVIAEVSDTPIPNAHPAGSLKPWTSDNYSFAYWQNGWRKHKGDDSADILCFETGRYGLALDMADFSKTRFGVFGDGVGYAGALQAGATRMDRLGHKPLILEVETRGRTYRAVKCRAGSNQGSNKLYSTRMWESGKLVQHFDLLGLHFENQAGEDADCEGTLDIVAWPDAFSLNLDIMPGSFAWTNALIRIRLGDHQIEEKIPGHWDPDASKRFTLRYNIGDQTPLPLEGVQLHLSRSRQEVSTEFDKGYSCYVARTKNLPRETSVELREGRIYDEFDVVIQNSTDAATTVPFLLDLTNPLNITGLCPILCDENGVPTGIPVQLSKNWHEQEMGSYLRAYTLIPAAPGTTRYTLRIVYGFYGTLPSASHAQLSLIGWGTDSGGNGNNGRWHQLAIGCWGETFCFDMDMSCVDIAITDVRMLMARNGLDGDKWNWTDAGWGGDWLNLKDKQGNKLYFNELKTAYISHGPCLTEVRYAGFYGSDRQVDLKATVRTLRTDDFARTFQTLSYTFNKPVTAADGWLFKMGRTTQYATPKIAYGNARGLIREHRVPDHIKRDEPFIENVSLTGTAPWWTAFPGAYHYSTRDWGTGSRALVMRGYKAVIGGKEYTRPTISFPVFQVHADGTPNLDMILAPPEGIDTFQPGDEIHLDMEWITLHRIAEDYYGPNELYRKHLKKNPRSWKSVYREAKGNDLKIQVAGGTVKNRYPVIIETEASEVQLKITGGVGAVPVRFDGLDSSSYALYQVIGDKRVRLDQSVHGNDFWQTDYDPESESYSLTFNLQLDRHPTSGWILKPNE